VLQKILQWETHCDVWKDKYPNTPPITTVFLGIFFIIHNVLQDLGFTKPSTGTSIKHNRKRELYTLYNTNSKGDTSQSFKCPYRCVFIYRMTLCLNMQHIKLIQLTQIFILTIPIFIHSTYFNPKGSPSGKNI
jgi:hypothetical protein